MKIKNFFYSSESYYCNTTKSQAEIFWNRQKGKIKNRGRVLEIDRLNSKRTYSKDNCVFCCYWCNNAMSDIFYEEQFRLIGKSIGKVISNACS